MEKKLRKILIEKVINRKIFNYKMKNNSFFCSHRTFFPSHFPQHEKLHSKVSWNFLSFCVWAEKKFFFLFLTKRSKKLFLLLLNLFFLWVWKIIARMRMKAKSFSQDVSSTTNCNIPAAIFDFLKINDIYSLPFSPLTLRST
jgi:hypothetical protein